MLKPNPASRRQLTADGPMALWRDGTNGREGLVLSIQACASLKCPCRDVAIEGWVVSDQLLGVSFERQVIRFSFDGQPRLPERKVLDVSVDVDTGAVTPDTKSSQSWAIDWFRKECDVEMLTSLRGQFAGAKQAVVSPPFDWRTADWSGWTPGRDVGWRDLYADDDEASDVVLDGQTYVLGDCYCVVPGCTCDEIQIIVWHEAASDGALTELGYVTVAASKLAGAQFHAHGPARALVLTIWKAWCDAYPAVALLLNRQAEVRKLVPEFQTLMAKRGRPTPASGVSKTKAVGPNKPCPCGSGKKYKRCCMEA